GAGDTLLSRGGPVGAAVMGLGAAVRCSGRRRPRRLAWPLSSAPVPSPTVPRCRDRVAAGRIAGQRGGWHGSTSLPAGRGVIALAHFPDHRLSRAVISVSRLVRRGIGAGRQPSRTDVDAGGR